MSLVAMAFLPENAAHWVMIVTITVFLAIKGVSYYLDHKNADTNYTIDADTWYSQCAQKVLTDIITDLNARGTKTLCIMEDGRMVIDDDKQVGTLKAFPGKNLWKKIVSIFEENGLKAVENENSIEIAW